MEDQNLRAAPFKEKEEAASLVHMVINPDLTVSGLLEERNYFQFPEHLSGVELQRVWQEHRARGGREYIQDGDTLDHKTVKFGRILMALGAASVAGIGKSAQVKFHILEPRKLLTKEQIELRQKIDSPQFKGQIQSARAG